MNQYIGRCIKIRICSFRQWTKTLVALSNSRWTSRRNQNPSPPWNPWRACRPSPWSSRRHPSSPWPRRRRGRSSPWSTRRRSSTATRSIIVTPNHNLKTTNGYPFDVVPRRGELTRGIFHSAPASTTYDIIVFSRSVPTFLCEKFENEIADGRHSRS